ncbi:cysteine/O-acetylserine exporter [Raoultella ornithinolytica]|nr:cysteine/O-acetylserine exporter [Raoultella ornithinolytica]
MILIVTMFIFSLTMSFSPGPVNMIIISSAAAHGFRKTFPFVSGATTGFTALLIFVCFGFYAAIEQHPLFSNISTLLAQYLSCTWVIK